MIHKSGSRSHTLAVVIHGHTSSDKKRNADGFLMGNTLTAPTMAAHHVAMITEEHNLGVIQQVCLPQTIHHPSEVLVDIFNHRIVSRQIYTGTILARRWNIGPQGQLLGLVASVFRWSHIRTMRGYNGDHHEERFVGIFSSAKADSMRQERMRTANIDDKLQDLISKSDVIVKLLQGQLSMLEEQKVKVEGNLSTTLDEREAGA